ncbi:MAG: DUF4623 domain-containing protein [Tepidisphaerales bacterium]
MNQKLGALAVLAAVGLTASSVWAQFTLSPLASFGGGDGWRAPGETVAGDAPGTTGILGNYLYLNSDVNYLERGIAFNPVTGNLILVSRAPEANWIRILDGLTGADKGPLSLGPTNFITGGTFARNMVGVTTDGVIYMGNLTINTNSAPLKIYRWENESAEPTVHYEGNAGLPGARVGDTLAVFGPDSGGKIALGFGSTPAVTGNNGFTVIPTGAPNPPATLVTLPLAPAAGGTAAGDFRLGIAFYDADTVVGTQGAGVSGRLRVASFDSAGVGTLDASPFLNGNPSIERGMAVTEVDGRKLLATVAAGGFTANDPPSATQAFANTVSVYDITDPASPVLLATAKNIPTAIANTNPNGTSSVAWGARVGNTINLYALNTNNGIQAFTLTLPPTGPNIVLGDFNFDGFLDAGDIDVFTEALLESAPYAEFIANYGALFTTQYGGTLTPELVVAFGDFDNNSIFDADDIDPFIEAVLASSRPGASSIPEPAALGLLAPAALLLSRRRQR